MTKLILMFILKKKQKNKYKKLAEVWLTENKIAENMPYQIDIIAISGKEIKFFSNAVAEN